MSGLSREVLNVVKKKTGKTVSEQSIKKIASGVTPKTLQSEAELRKLVLKVSKTFNLPVSDSTIKQIIRAVKANGSSGALEQLIASMIKK